MKALLSSARAALLLGTCLLTGCAGQVRSDVTLFHEYVLPRGETIRVLAADPEKAGSLEFGHYARMVEDQLRRIGYAPVTGDAPAALVATVDWSVADKDTLVRTRPGSFVRYHFAYGHIHDPFYFGLHDDWEHETYTYVVYHRELSVLINESSPPGRHVFEGRVHSVGREREISKVMPYLVTALFRNYPGESGITKVVTIEKDQLDE